MTAKELEAINELSYKHAQESLDKIRADYLAPIVKALLKIAEKRVNHASR